MRVCKDVTLNFDLCIGEGAINNLRLKRDTGAALTPVVEPHSTFQPDLSFGNSIRIFHSDGAVGIQIVMVQGPRGHRRPQQQNQEQRTGAVRTRTFQW